ncbi:synaptic vesicle glycoprotein 2C isoform X1 [Erpetoichthys calabaricus]|nr:synaptic vesicle glycoprotein 2C isoform X1 [Erpetoichthys calabaricus]
MCSRIPKREDSDGAREPLLGNSGSVFHESPVEAEVVTESESSLCESTTTAFSYEDAINEAGFGLFHGWLLIVCGWANASDAIEILSVSFLLPAARCDLQLTSSDMGFLIASTFLGMAIGGYVWGYLADKNGRQKILAFSLAINGLFAALSSLATTFWLFLLLRFISGIGVGGSIPVIFSYFSEFQPRKKRGVMISCLATFWMVGNILVAGLAWLVIPRTFIRFQLGNLNFESWRVFVGLCSIPSLSSGLLFGFVMPESPKYLMEVGNETVAIHVFHKMFVCNHRGSIKKFPICKLNISNKRAEKSAAKDNLNVNTLCHIIKQTLGPSTKLFRAPLTSRSIVLLIVFFCISFGYYGLWMWLPELFKRQDEGDVSCSITFHQTDTHQINNESCSPPKRTVFTESLIIAGANLPGNIFSIFLMDVVGGRILLVFSLLLSGLSVFFFWAVKTKTQSLVMSCIFSAVSVVSWNALDLIGTELYPTQLRSCALGFFTGVGRLASILANIVFGQLVDTNCAVTLLLVAAMLCIGGLTASKLPQTKHAELM